MCPVCSTPFRQTDCTQGEPKLQVSHLAGVAATSSTPAVVPAEGHCGPRPLLLAGWKPRARGQVGQGPCIAALAVRPCCVPRGGEGGGCWTPARRGKLCHIWSSWCTTAMVLLCPGREAANCRQPEDSWVGPHPTQSLSYCTWFLSGPQMFCL